MFLNKQPKLILLYPSPCPPFPFPLHFSPPPPPFSPYPHFPQPNNHTDLKLCEATVQEKKYLCFFLFFKQAAKRHTCLLLYPSPSTFLPLFYFCLAPTPLPYPTFHYPTIYHTDLQLPKFIVPKKHPSVAFFFQTSSQTSHFFTPPPPSISLSSIYLLPPPSPHPFPPPLSTNYLSHRPSAPQIQCAKKAPICCILSSNKQSKITLLYPPPPLSISLSSIYLLPPPPPPPPPPPTIPSPTFH